MRSWIHWLLAILVGFSCVQAPAQLRAEDPDWKENEVPPAPEFDRKRLVRFEIPIGADMQFGVDPATIVIGNDGVIRYVVVASSPSGSMNAMYEAIRCSTGEFKTYARRTADSPWSMVSQPTWQLMQANRPSRYAWYLARQGLCTGSAPALTVADIVRNLKSPPKETR